MEDFCVLEVNCAVLFSKIRPLRAYFCAAIIIREDTGQRRHKGMFGLPESSDPVHPIKSYILIVNPGDFTVFRALLAITRGFRPPNSTKQAHVNPFTLPGSTRNRHSAIILTMLFFNGGFLCPGGELFSTIQ